MDNTRNTGLRDVDYYLFSAEVTKDKVNSLRKDQIYFIEKNKQQASELYSLVEFDNVRNDRQNWELRYLSGSFGATPNLKN